MTVWTLRSATPRDLSYLSPRLRTEDIAESKAATGMSTFDALMCGMDGAQVILGSDGVPIAVFGVTPLIRGKAGAVWMAATPALTQPPYAGELLRNSRAMCDRLNEAWPLLCNVVDERNTTHIRWLEWSGFIFINRHPHYGVERRPFLEFVRIKPNV